MGVLEYGLQFYEHRQGHHHLFQLEDEKSESTWQAGQNSNVIGSGNRRCPPVLSGVVEVPVARCQIVTLGAAVRLCAVVSTGLFVADERDREVAAKRSENLGRIALAIGW